MKNAKAFLFIKKSFWPKKSIITISNSLSSEKQEKHNVNLKLNLYTHDTTIINNYPNEN